MTTQRMGEFLQHDQPVSCVAITPRGDLVATGDTGGNLLIWRPGDVQQDRHYAEAIAAAVRQLEDQAPTSTQSPAKQAQAQALVDESDEPTQLISLQANEAARSVQRLRAHDDTIESIRFSDDGREPGLHFRRLHAKTMERDHTNACQNTSRSWWLGHRCTIHNRHTRPDLIDFP